MTVGKTEMTVEGNGNDGGTDEGKIGDSVLKQPAVYILASKRNGTLYIGVTIDLIKRVWEHKNGFVDGFTKRHNVHLLVYYELHTTMQAAIAREKKLKKWNRAWKINLIEASNPAWCDLYQDIC